MKNTAICILNYKNYQMTLDFIIEIKAHFNADKFDIVVVDNNSPDGSAQELERLAGQGEKSEFHFILSDKNGGYASGNNLGIKWACQQGYKYTWVLNNDLIFSDFEILDKMCALMEQKPELAAVSPRIIDYNTKRELNRNLKKTTVLNTTVGRAFWVLKQKYKLQGQPKEKWCWCYRPQGCCMLLRNSAMADIDYMDERTFLYNEEEILAERLLRKNYRCACLLDGSIVHNHGATVSQTVDKWAAYNIQKESRKIYYEYAAFSPVKIKLLEFINWLQYVL